MPWLSLHRQMGWGWNLSASHHSNSLNQVIISNFKRLPLMRSMQRSRCSLCSVLMVMLERFGGVDLYI